MEPVILLITITAILSGTYIRSKKLSLERERMRLGLGLHDEPKSNFSNAIASKMNPALGKGNAQNQQDMEEMKRRIENLEVIITDGLEQAAGAGQVRKLQEEIKFLSEKIKQMER